jgi:vacuolar protein sorting-associated protein 54
VVPQVFFREDFDLSKKVTFEEVLQPEGIDVEAAEGTHQELSHYLDTVEMELSQAISDRSDRFFAALSSQQALNTEVLSVLDNIQVMRCHLANTQRDTSDVHLDFLSRLMRRKRGYELYEKLSSLAAVRQTQSTIQLLLATSDFVGALDLIGTTQEILRTDLKGIHCLKHLGSQLSEMKKVVERMMQDELISSLIDDLAQLKERHRLTAATTLKELVADHLVNAEIDISDSKDERLRALVSGVMRQQNVSFTEPYNKAAINHLQVSIKQQYVTWLPKAPPDEVTAQLPPGASSEAGFKLRLRLLPYDDWVQLMMSMSRMMLLTLIHLKENHGRIANALLLHCRDVEASLDLGADDIDAEVDPKAPSNHRVGTYVSPTKEDRSLDGRGAHLNERPVFRVDETGDEYIRTGDGETRHYKRNWADGATVEPL